MGGGTNTAVRKEWNWPKANANKLMVIFRTWAQKVVGFSLWFSGKLENKFYKRNNPWEWIKRDKLIKQQGIFVHERNQSMKSKRMKN